MESSNNARDGFPFVNMFWFFAVIFAGGFLFWVMPKKEISEGEKRKLAAFPNFSVENLFSGKYADSIDLYFSDNFLFRDELITAAGVVKSYRGIKDEEIQLYSRAGNPDEKTQQEEFPDELPTQEPEFVPIVSDTASKVEFESKKEHSEQKKSKIAEDFVPEKINNEGDYQNIKSVIVYNNRAIQAFAGSQKAASYFGKIFKKYKETLGEDVQLYCMAMPVGSDFFLPTKYSKNNRKEKQFIDMLYNEVAPYAKPVYAYELLDKHRDEYIQFNTDHHWTGRGAFYAYQAFGEAAGFRPYEMHELERKVIKGFLGTLYHYTLSEDLKSNKDSVEYFKIPEKTEAYYFTSGIEKGKPTKMLAEYARGGNSYGVFLGADHPLLRIISSVKNGRKILQIKDSYGNAFAPFLPAHFEEVFVIDYRYFKGSVKELVEKYGITDVILTHNVFMFNSAFTGQRALAFLEKKKADDSGQ
jgi:hypothetical protein